MKKTNLKQKKQKKELPAFDPQTAEKDLMKKLNEKKRQHGFSEDTPLSQEAMQNAIELTINPRLSCANPKVEAIIEKVQKSIPEEEKAKALSQDSQLNNLYIDLDKAKKDMRMTSVAIINRQIECRAKEILILQAEEKICKLICSGEIVKFVAKEDYDNLYKARMRVLLIYDLLDGALHDLHGAIASSGLVGEVDLLQVLLKSRKDIQQWCDKEMKQFDEKNRSILVDEMDRINTYVNKERIPVLYRKIQNHIKKNEQSA